MNSKLIRLALFVAYRSAIPFFFGFCVAVLTVSLAQVEVLNKFGEVFDNSFQAAILSCAK